MSRRILLLVGTGLLVLVMFLAQIPSVNTRVAWRYEVLKTYLKNMINPVGDVPTAVPNRTSTQPPASSTVPPGATLAITETVMPPTATTTSLPAQVMLDSPPYEKQTPNNCGPAAL